MSTEEKNANFYTQAIINSNTIAFSTWYETITTMT